MDSCKRVFNISDYLINNKINLYLYLLIKAWKRQASERGGVMNELFN